MYDFFVINLNLTFWLYFVLKNIPICSLKIFFSLDCWQVSLYNQWILFTCDSVATSPLNLRFTTSGMCAKNNTHMYVARTSNNRVISSGDLYFCLQPQCEALRTWHSGFPIAAIVTMLLPRVYLCLLGSCWKQIPRLQTMKFQYHMQILVIVSKRVLIY